jgi:multiple sugar transport system substrate-binding protein/raffinose/stachyose/melibiose transport system substrate-binding protein
MHQVSRRRVMAGLTSAAALGASARPARADGIKLTWFMWSGSEAEVTAWKRVAAMVTEKYPDISVEFQTTSFPDYWTKLPALAASGKLPDIVSLQSLRAPGFAGLMEPLDARIKADKFDIESFEQSILKGLSREGKQFALPYDFGPLILYYNRDMFVKAGVPLPHPGWTETEFMSAARALTKDGVYGFAVSQPDAFIAFAESKGAGYLDSSGDLDLTNDGLKKAFTKYAALVSVEKVAPLFPSSGTQSSGLANGRFTAGNVAMYVDGPWQLVNVKKKAAFTVGLAPIPAREAGSITITAGSGFGIATTSKNKDAAWKAIQVMTGPDAEKYLGEQGRAFSARQAMQTAWYEVAAKDVVGAREAIDAALKTARPYVTTPNWSTVAASLEQYAPLAYGGSEPPAKVLETIQTLASQ